MKNISVLFPMYLLIYAAYHSMNETNISLYCINKVVFVKTTQCRFLEIN